MSNSDNGPQSSTISTGGIKEVLRVGQEPSVGTALVKGTTNEVVRRGLELASDLQRTEAVVSELEVKEFLDRLRDAESSIGDLSTKLWTVYRERGKLYPDIGLFPEIGLSRHFKAFDQLTLQPGYELDWVYATDIGRARPLIYARKSDEPRLRTSLEYYQSIGTAEPEILCYMPDDGEQLPFLRSISYTNTPLGCFQFSYFCKTISMFQLHSDYLLQRVANFILTPEELKGYLSRKVGLLERSVSDRLSQLSPLPRVRIEGRKAEVTMWFFNSHIGYALMNVLLVQPNQFVSTSEQQLADSNEVKLR